MRKITRSKVEHALDGLVVDFLLDNQESTLKRFKSAVDFFERAGYNMKEYFDIYLEIKNDLEEFNWIDVSLDR